MKIRNIAFGAVLLLGATTFAQSGRGSNSERISWCAHKMDGSGSATFKDIWFCKSDDPQSSHQTLCYAHYTSTGTNGTFNHYVVLEFDKDGDAWRTSANKAEVDNHSLKYTADQRMMFANSTLTDVEVNYSSMKISLDTYTKSYLVFKESLGVETYSCTRN